MYRFLVLFVLFTACCGVPLIEECNPFKNVKATVYGGGRKEVTLTSKEDLRDAYKVEIEDADIGELCAGALSGLKELDTLMIKNSNIKKISAGAFEGCDSLRTLDLTDNDIKYLPEGVFSELNIRRVNLTNNEISKIHKNAFNDMPNLQTVELGGNKISKWDSEWFEGSPLVYRIVMDKNKIKILPKDMLKNPAASSQRKQKIQVWLSENLIEEVHPEAFRNVQDLDSLWLDRNRISSLDDATFDNVRIGTLAVNENQLGCLQDPFLSRLDVKDLMIDMNPMDCDCLRRLRKWAAKNSVEMTAIRRGLECAREKIDTIFKAQKKYYEDQLEMERRF